MFILYLFTVHDTKWSIPIFVWFIDEKTWILGKFQNPCGKTDFSKNVNNFLFFLNTVFKFIVFFSDQPFIVYYILIYILRNICEFF